MRHDRAFQHSRGVMHNHAVLLSRSVGAAAVPSRCRDLLAALQFGPHSTGMGCGWQLELGCGRLCLYRWWVRGWEICRSYQNCASRRDSHGHGSQAAQPGLAQLILVFPSGVLSSTGRCVAMRRGRASVVACMSSLLPSGSGQACWSWFHLPGFKRLPPARADLFCADSPPPPEALTVQT